MNDYNPGSNTFTWEAGSSEILVIRKANVGTVTSPTIEIYKQGNENNLASTLLSSANATVSQDGDTVTITSATFLNTIPSGVYKIRWLGTLNSVVQVIHAARADVIKKSAI